MKRFLYLTGVLTFLCLVALVSYLVTLHYTAPGDSSDSIRQTGTETAGELPADGIQAVTDRVNLIYGVQEKTQTVTALILEVWDREQGTLAYITIPADTGYTLSKELYQRLAVCQPEVPQMGRLSHLYRYFEKEDAGEYGRQILEELLDVGISRYTVLDGKELKSRFHQNENGMWRFRKAFREQEKDWKTEEWSIVEEEPESISFYLVPGEERNAGYELDRIGLYRELMGILPFYSSRTEEE